MSYPLTPVPFTQVALSGHFWLPRLETNRTVTLPYALAKCEATGRVDNFLKAAGKLDGPHTGLVFNDSDIYKALEGAAYSLSLHPDTELDAYLDGLIAKVADAQEPDGYLYTARTVDPNAVKPDREGLTRWSNLRFNHELYNLGHLYEAAVAHFRATGKRTLLDVAIRSADLLVRVFGPTGLRDVPGHQEVELGLVKLYGVTGDVRYLELAHFFLNERGHHHARTEHTLLEVPGYAQDHLPVTEQGEAVGHAVRALYMYAAMTDLAALTAAAAYRWALDALWHDVVTQKLYLTGGLGARHHGEAFGDAYELPNRTAYAETCAAIANVLWNHRMFLLHGDAKYLDVLERTLYNGLLAGVALSGDRFFYPNPLASDGVWAFNMNEGATRSPWFECSCCPTNVVRFMPSLPGYVCAVRDDTLYVNLFVSCLALVTLGQTEVRITQETRYPWDGTVHVTLNPATPAAFELALRVPGWAQGRPVPSDLYTYLDPLPDEVTLELNGAPVPLRLENGFTRLTRTWQAGDTVTLRLPLRVRRVVSHEAVAENRGRVALERGPLVYCAEAVDHGGAVSALRLSDTAPLSARHDPALLGGVTLIEGAGLTLVPYYAWSHRGAGEMQVWLERQHMPA